MSQSRFRLSGPLVGAGIVGVLAASYIAYYLYRQLRKRRFMRYLKRIYNNDHELYDEAEDEYSDEDDFYIDERTIDSQRLTSRADLESIHGSGRSRSRYPYGGLTRRTKGVEEFEQEDNIENLGGSAKTRVPRSHFYGSFKSRLAKASGKRDDADDDDDWVNVDDECSRSPSRKSDQVEAADEAADSGADSLSDEDAEAKSAGIDASCLVEAAGSAPAAGSALPGRQRVYFKSFGCAHNMSDAEYMKGLLSEYGYTICDTVDSANVAVINSCTVKGPSQDAMTTEIVRARKLGIPVVVGGCVSQADRSLGVFQDPGVSLLGVQQIEEIVGVVEQALHNRKVTLLDRKALPSLNLPKIRQNKLIEIIPLSTGCLGACTFCKTKQARGVLGSYSLEAILDRVESVVAEGIQQIWLTSEDTGAYGIDLGTDIVTLLRGITALLPPNVMLRLGMSNPPYIKRHIAGIVEILRHPNVFEFLHLPVQSGSDRVLDLMNREYHIEDFEYLVDCVRKELPECTIATDIICGFPTETDEDHRQTLDLIDRLKLPVVNISQFYPRPGTPAAKMKPHGNKVKKTRTREVTQLFMSYERNSVYVGRTLSVWFSDVDNQRGHTVGHTKTYVKVVVPLDPDLVGRKALVTIEESSKWHLKGTVSSLDA
ncbi:CDK5 regulatory subunit-associated protein [Babesia bigemina]|uniref:Threonylcarbamoyladenosine tRNA methylthiotransferase n=1 Tax=Babesia bigemina TaxID=5866 RepID=A0A061D833_BABBI|nr:CDK5 regulatory subunit-associated protein [Babesia bigemina]CDR96821.1 CDK5 regulatory subunit-associated protein [Babesia bigemina]|eukprot:XP_012769007.1 CDK5 regulatory subunit-associated protein [Babesia bigemina]